MKSEKLDDLYAYWKEIADDVKAFNEAVERLKAEYPYFEVGSSQKTAAKNVRTLLERVFPCIQFHVRNTRSTTVTIRWTDGPSVKDVEDLVCRFKRSYFSIMTGSYESRKNPFNSTFGEVQYISYSRAYSDGLISRAIDEIADEFVATEKPTVEEYRLGGTWNSSPHPDCVSWCQLISKKLAETRVPGSGCKNGS